MNKQHIVSKQEVRRRHGRATTSREGRGGTSSQQEEDQNQQSAVESFAADGAAGSRETPGSSFTWANKPDTARSHLAAADDDEEAFEHLPGEEVTERTRPGAMAVAGIDSIERQGEEDNATENVSEDSPSIPVLEAQVVTDDDDRSILLRRVEELEAQNQAMVAQNQTVVDATPVNERRRKKRLIIGGIVLFVIAVGVGVGIAVPTPLAADAPDELESMAPSASVAPSLSPVPTVTLTPSELFTDLDPT